MTICAVLHQTVSSLYWLAPLQTMCASDKNPVDFPTSEQRCRLFPQSIRLFCIVCRTGAIFCQPCFIPYIIQFVWYRQCVFSPKKSILLLQFLQKNCRYTLHLFLWIFAGYFTSYSLFLPFFPFFSSFFLFSFFSLSHPLFPILSLFNSFYSDSFPPPRHFHEEHKKSIVFVRHAHIPLGRFSDIKEGLHAK